jgi:hypothetical protein
MITKERKNLPYRSWFYFRTGWSTYFAFVFAAINTLVVTYYLAIEKVPNLKEVFPTFTYYAIFMIGIGIPALILFGYAHYKKSGAYRSEANISAEANPYYYRLPPGYTIDVLFPLHLKMSQLLVKIILKETVSKEEIDELVELQNKMQFLINGGNLNEKTKKPSKKKTDITN